MDILKQSDEQLVIVPKSMFGGRTGGLMNLFNRAGFDCLEKKGLGRDDEVVQEGFRFRALKDPKDLAEQFELSMGQVVPIILGDDVLFEADLLARTRGVRSDLRRVLSLNLAGCTMQILVKSEEDDQAVDLNGRRLFSKYPNIAQRLIYDVGAEAEVRGVTGSDNWVSRYRDQEDLRVAALEVVGSGETARKLGLSPLGPDRFNYPDTIEGFDFMNVSTNLTVSNITLARSSSTTRDKIAALGLALEMAMPRSKYAMIVFNIPKKDLDRFRGFGMRGPTVSEVVTKNGEEWLAMEIGVKEENAGQMLVRLMDMGAYDVVLNRGGEAGVSAEESEVIRELPRVA